MIGCTHPDFHVAADSVGHAVALINLYVETFDNTVGGNLHIVISDGNLEDEHIQYCLTNATEQKDHVGVAIAQVLLEMTPAERREVYDRL